MRGGHHRKLAAWHVAAHRLHWDVLVAQDDTRLHLNLDVGHAVALRLGKAAHVFLRELQVFHLARGDAGDERVDFLLAELERRGRVAVEFLGQFSHRHVTARLDIGQGCFDHSTHLCVVVIAVRGGFPALEVFNCHMRDPSLSKPSERPRACAAIWLLCSCRRRCKADRETLSASAPLPKALSYRPTAGGGN